MGTEGNKGTKERGKGSHFHHQYNQHAAVVTALLEVGGRVKLTGKTVTTEGKAAMNIPSADEFHRRNKVKWNDALCQQDAPKKCAMDALLVAAERMKSCQ